MDKRHEAIEEASTRIQEAAYYHSNMDDPALEELYDKAVEHAAEVVYEITGEELRDLLYWMEDDITKISVCMDGGLKIKFNEGQWTLPLGARKGS